MGYSAQTDLTIPISSSPSNIIENHAIRQARKLVFRGPAAATGSLEVQVARVGGAAAGDMKTLNVNGTTQVVPVDEENVVDVEGITAVRVNSTGTEAAERTITFGVII